MNFTNHMTSCVNTFKEEQHSDEVNKQKNWTRTGWSLALWAEQKVKQSGTGRGFINEVGRAQGPDPALRLATSRRLLAVGKVNFFSFWNVL